LSEMINQLIIITLLSLITLITGITIMVLRKLLRKLDSLEEKIKMIVTQKEKKEEPGQPPRGVQEARKSSNEPLKEDTNAAASPDEYSWILQLGKRKQGGRTSRQ